jgi:hypothetical protein
MRQPRLKAAARLRVHRLVAVHGRAVCRKPPRFGRRLRAAWSEGDFCLPPVELAVLQPKPKAKRKGKFDSPAIVALVSKAATPMTPAEAMGLPLKTA